MALSTASCNKIFRFSTISQSNPVNQTMASKMLDHVDPESSGLQLSDDILFFLAKYFLNNTDCLALALSGSSESFPTILGSRINMKK